MTSGTKLSIFISVAIGAILVVFGWYIMSTQRKTLLADSDERLFEQVNDLQNLINLQIEENQTKVIKYGELAFDAFYQDGKLALNNEKSIPVLAINQESKNSQQIQLPELIYNNLPLYHNYDFVTHIESLTKGANTIFQKFNGGFIRISTNIKNEDGERAVNTFIPQTSPVAQALERGETYEGRAIILNQWYLTFYRPLLVDNSVVGAYFFGIPEKDLSTLKDIFHNKKYYENGYPYVVDGEGNLLVHPLSEGKNIANETFFKDMVSAKEGKIKYDWEGRAKYQHFSHIPKADVYIATTVYESDLLIELNHAKNAVFIAIFLGITIALAIGWLMGKNIQNSIRKVVNQTNELVNAAVGGHLDIRANPEETHFEYREIVVGVNKTLDAVIGPLNVAAEYVDRISKGDIPPRITDNYTISTRSRTT